MTTVVVQQQDITTVETLGWAPHAGSGEASGPLSIRPQAQVQFRTSDGLEFGTLSAGVLSCPSGFFYEQDGESVGLSTVSGVLGVGLESGRVTAIAADYGLIYAEHSGDLVAFYQAGEHVFTGLAGAPLAEAAVGYYKAASEITAVSPGVVYYEMSSGGWYAVFPRPHTPPYTLTLAGGGGGPLPPAETITLSVGQTIYTEHAIPPDWDGDVVSVGVVGEVTLVEGLREGEVVWPGPPAIRFVVQGGSHGVPPPPRSPGVAWGNSDGWDRGVLHATKAVTRHSADMTWTCEVEHYPQARMLACEDRLKIGGEWYRVREVRRSRVGSRVREVAIGESEHTLLRRAPRLPKRVWQGATVNQVLSFCLAGTGWTVGTVGALPKASWVMEPGSPLACLSQAREVYGGDVVWDTQRRVLSWWVQRHDWSYRLWAPEAGLNSLEIVENADDRVTHVTVEDEGDTYRVEAVGGQIGDRHRHEYVRVRKDTPRSQAKIVASQRLRAGSKPTVTATADVFDDRRVELGLHTLMYVADPAVGFRGMLKVTEIERDWLVPERVRVRLSSDLWFVGSAGASRAVGDPTALGLGGTTWGPTQVSGYAPLPFGVPAQPGGEVIP